MPKEKLKGLGDGVGPVYREPGTGLFTFKEPVGGDGEVVDLALPDPEGNCRHDWIIAEAMGSFSDGECNNCGEQRTFRNSISDGLWAPTSGYARRNYPSSPSKRIDESEDDG